MKDILDGKKFKVYDLNTKAIVRKGAMGAAVSVKFWQGVHELVNFETFCVVFF